VARSKRLKSKDARRQRGAASRASGNLHPQVRIEHEGVSAEVDEAMAPLVLELWRHGFDTGGSCFSFPPLNDLVKRAVAGGEAGFADGSYAYVTFRDPQYQERFLAVAERASSGRLVVADVAGDFPADAAAEDPPWSVGFPTKDIGAVLEALVGKWSDGMGTHGHPPIFVRVEASMADTNEH
jgi:hypothetical protein